MIRNDMEWYGVIPLQTPSLIDEYEQLKGFRFPQDFREFIVRYNGGTPDHPDGDVNKDFVVQIPSPYFDSGYDEDDIRLCSFNKDDPGSIWDGDPDWSQELLDRYVMFADDSFGNFFCYDRQDLSIVFIDHEAEEVIPLAKSFTDLINSMYIVEDD